MTDQYMLTTVDNPYNPVTQFDEWRVWDERSGYNTLAYLGRVVITSDELSETDQVLALQQAIDDIVDANGGLYKKVAVPANLEPTV